MDIHANVVRESVRERNEEWRGKGGAEDTKQNKTRNNKNNTTKKKQKKTTTTENTKNKQI